MVVPPGHTEEFVLAEIERCVVMLAPDFVFGYYDLEDVKQEARYEALKVLPRYDPALDEDGNPTRPLANFLYRGIRNRLLNLVRNKYHRNDPPCRLCHDGRQADHPDGEVCLKYKAWRKRNAAKANLTKPQGIDSVVSEKEVALRADGLAAEEAVAQEVLLAIDEKLPLELRADYLRMRAGERLPKDRRRKVEVAILAILRPEEPDDA